MIKNFSPKMSRSSASNYPTFKPLKFCDSSDDEEEVEEVEDEKETMHEAYWRLRSTSRLTKAENIEMGNLGAEIKEMCNVLMNEASQFEPSDAKRIVKFFSLVPEEYRTEKCLQFYMKRLVKYMNKFWAVIEGEKVQFLSTKYNTSRGQWFPEEHFFRNKENAALVQGQYRIQWANVVDEKEGRPISMFAFWLGHPAHRRYDGKTFYPELESTHVKINKFNIFMGFNVLQDEAESKVKDFWWDSPEYLQGTTGFTGDQTINARNSWIDARVRPWTDHIRNIWCKGDTEQAEYVFNWFAHLVQKPWIKMGVTMLLRGAEGAGKGSVIQKVGEIIGDQGFKQPTDVDDCLGTFAAYIMEGALLLFMDEAVWGGDKKASGKLKKIITEGKYYSQKKFGDVLLSESFTNIVMASNEEWNFPAGRGARRLFALDVDERFCGIPTIESRAHFKAIVDVPSHFLAHWLYTRDVSSFVPTACPETEALQEQKIMSQEPIEKWWHECLVDWPEWLNSEISKTEVYRIFQEVIPTRYKQCAQFWRAMSKMTLFESRRETIGEKRCMAKFQGMEEQRKRWIEYQHVTKWNFN